MIIEIAQIPEAGLTCAGHEPGSSLGLDADRLFRNIGPIEFDLSAELISGELVVEGAVHASLECVCSRCAEFFSTTIEDSSFLRAYEISDTVETVDISPDLRDAVLLFLPAFPLCTPDCAGLCPQCGTNRNQGSCTCSPPDGDLRWDSLDALRLD